MLDLALQACSTSKRPNLLGLHLEQRHHLDQADMVALHLKRRQDPLNGITVY